uniref:Uncharacterized protein n=1 Tax=Mycena chlorophos TaxID=658473 RepID=A0ABQ0M528_MYCCL|nr:predicted protein [Mycena chlorophos]
MANCCVLRGFSGRLHTVTRRRLFPPDDHHRCPVPPDDPPQARRHQVGTMGLLQNWSPVRPSFHLQPQSRSITGLPSDSCGLGPAVLRDVHRNDLRVEPRSSSLRPVDAVHPHIPAIPHLAMAVPCG